MRNIEKSFQSPASRIAVVLAILKIFTPSADVEAGNNTKFDEVKCNSSVKSVHKDDCVYDNNLKNKLFQMCPDGAEGTPGIAFKTRLASTGIGFAAIQTGMIISANCEPKKPENKTGKVRCLAAGPPAEFRDRAPWIYQCSKDPKIGEKIERKVSSMCPNGTDGAFNTTFLTESSNSGFGSVAVQTEAFISANCKPEK